MTRKPGEYNIFVNIFTEMGSCMCLRLRRTDEVKRSKVKVTAGGGLTVDCNPSSSIYSVPLYSKTLRYCGIFVGVDSGDYAQGARTVGVSSPKRQNFATVEIPKLARRCHTFGFRGIFGGF